VVCGDTLGKDREIEEPDRSFIETFVKLLAQSWEEMEKTLLRKDVEAQIAYLEGLNAQPVDLVQNYEEQCDKAVEERSADFEALKDAQPHVYEYELECVRLEKVKEFLAEPAFQEQFFRLKESRVLRFS